MMIAYIAPILRSQLEQTHCARLWFYMSDWLSVTRFLNIRRSGVLTALAWLVPHETAAVWAHVLCTSYNHAPCYFIQSHIRKVYACLAVIFHQHFWQNDRDLLRATAVSLNTEHTARVSSVRVALVPCLVHKLLWGGPT